MTFLPWAGLFLAEIALSLFWLVTRRIARRFLRAAQSRESPYLSVAPLSTDGLAGHYFGVRVRDEAAFIAFIRAGLAGRALPGARLWLWLHVLYLPVFLLILTILIIWTPHTPPALRGRHSW